MKVKVKVKNKITIVKSILIGLLIISSSISLPILIRPFYYIHIKAMDLPSISGFTAEQIKQSYDEVMDYCIGLKPEFSAGVFKYSESGASHFADVRILFKADLMCVLICIFLLVLIHFISKHYNLREYRYHNRGALFYGSAFTMLSFVSIGALASLNFDKAFTVFHNIFFNGKDNWVFSPKTDPIITVLPKQFFMNCAIFILLAILIECGICLVLDYKKSRLYKQTTLS